MAVANQCSSCGIQRPAEALGTLCPGCATSQSVSGRTLDSKPFGDGATSEIKPKPQPWGSSVISPIFFDSPNASSRPGSTGNFGEYEIRRELGRGGMGIVYEALHVRLDRPVALKMVRSGLLAGPQELRRFQNEAQSVARLDHPNIVQIFEVGEHNGQSFLSMRLVTGGSLLSELDKFRDNPRRAVELMVQIVDAISHAHMRGVLHRDLKPANILLDEAGHPHITDFGLAKQVESDIEITQSGAIVGTPSYMAPEQASGNRAAITTATDVYGLGAVFYALLTAKAPFTRDSVVETLDAVRHVEPDRPSKITSAIPRDLETICLKCLEKDPARRYASARALADDLNAWLESRPIAARRVRAAERTWLWCKRKPALAALVATAGLALIGGGAGIIFVQASANKALAAKNAALAQANQESEQRFTLAMDAIRSFYTGVSDDVMLREKSLSPLRKSLLESARSFYQKMETQLAGKSDRASRTQLAKAYYEIAKLTGEIDNTEAAVAAHQKALDLRRILATEPDAGPDAIANVADSVYEICICKMNVQQYDQAKELAGQAADLYRTLVREHPTNERYRVGLAQSASVDAFGRSRAGKLDEAIDAWREIRAMYQTLSQDFPNNIEYPDGEAGAISSISSILHDQGKKDEARTLMAQALHLLEQQVESHPKAERARQSLAKTYLNTAARYPSARSQAAVSYYRNAISVWDGLIAESTSNRHLVNVGVAYDGLAKRYCTLRQNGDEIKAYEQELAAFEHAALIDPSNPVFLREIADCCEHIATYQLRQGRTAEALAHCLRATQIRESLVTLDSMKTPWLLAASYDQLGDAQAVAGQALEARSSYSKSLDAWKGCPDAQRENVPPFYIRAMAVADRKLGRTAEAASAIREVLELAEAKPDRDAETWFGLGRTRAQLYALSTDPSSGVSSNEGEQQAAKAVEDLRRSCIGKRASLREALSADKIDIDRIEQTRELDPLRPRADFQALLVELSWQELQ